MDPNKDDTTATIVNKKQLVLNTMKNKISDQTNTEAPTCSPPKFEIPLLKIPGSSHVVKENSQQSTQLNQFLLKQLQEKHKKCDLTKGHNGFVLPQLQTTSNSKQAVKFELPVFQTLSTTSTHSKINSLTTAIKNLQVQDSEIDAKIPTPHAIDLTTALVSNMQKQGTPPTRDFVNPIQNSTEEVDFKIPFIDCDRLDVYLKRALLLPSSNNYCITDISQLILHHSFVEPSAVGRFLCLNDDKYSAPLPLKCLSADYRQQKVKHHIVPFQFDKKSPDDLVLEALSKYQRRHIN